MSAAPGSPAESDADHRVALQVPADVSYVGVVRTLAASLAARLPFTIDEIDDLRIAVDEAFALLMPVAVRGSTVRVAYRTDDSALEVSVDVDATPGVALDQGGFGWTVLDALAHVADVREADGTVGLTLHKDAEETGALVLADVSEPAAP